MMSESSILWCAPARASLDGLVVAPMETFSSNRSGVVTLADQSFLRQALSTLSTTERTRRTKRILVDRVHLRE